MKEVYFRDLRTNPEKYLKSKPKELTLKQAKKNWTRFCKLLIDRIN